MDILATIIASIILLVGFLIVCRPSDDEEEGLEPEESETPSDKANHT